MLVAFRRQPRRRTAVVFGLGGLAKGRVRGHYKPSIGKFIPTYTTKRPEAMQAAGQLSMFGDSGEATEGAKVRPAAQGRAIPQEQPKAPTAEGMGWAIKPDPTYKRKVAADRAAKAQEHAEGAVNACLAMIAAAHRLPKLDIEVHYHPHKLQEGVDAGVTAGKYRPVSRELYIGRGRETIIHEIGHAIDHQIFGTGGIMWDCLGSGPGFNVPLSQALTHRPNPKLAPLMDAIGKSDAVRGLLRTVAAGKITQKQYRYYTSKPELFARAYQQWVLLWASRGLDGDEYDDLRNEFREDAGKDIGDAYWWSDDDFAPIAAELEKLFADIDLQKALRSLLKAVNPVAAYTRRGKSGQIVQVGGYTRDRRPGRGGQQQQAPAQATAGPRVTMKPAKHASTSAEDLQKRYGKATADHHAYIGDRPVMLRQHGAGGKRGYAVYDGDGKLMATAHVQALPSGQGAALTATWTAPEAYGQQSHSPLLRRLVGEYGKLYSPHAVHADLWATVQRMGGDQGGGEFEAADEGNRKRLQRKAQAGLFDSEDESMAKSVLRWVAVFGDVAKSLRALRLLKGRVKAHYKPSIGKWIPTYTTKRPEAMRAAGQTSMFGEEDEGQEEQAPASAPEADDTIVVEQWGGAPGATEKVKPVKAIERALILNAVKYLAEGMAEVKHLREGRRGNSPEMKKAKAAVAQAEAAIREYAAPIQQWAQANPEAAEDLFANAFAKARDEEPAIGSLGDTLRGLMLGGGGGVSEAEAQAPTTDAPQAGGGEPPTTAAQAPESPEEDTPEARLYGPITDDRKAAIVAYFNGRGMSADPIPAGGFMVRDSDGNVDFIDNRTALEKIGEADPNRYPPEPQFDIDTEVRIEDRGKFGNPLIDATVIAKNPNGKGGYAYTVRLPDGRERDVSAKEIRTPAPKSLRAASSPRRFLVAFPTHRKGAA